MASAQRVRMPQTAWLRSGHVARDADGDQAGQDDEEREEHLGDRGDQRDRRAEASESAAMARWTTRKSVHQ